MKIKNAKYIKEIRGGVVGENECIKATIDGAEWFVPLTLDSRRYAEIIKQVDAGELTIEPADE